MQEEKRRKSQNDHEKSQKDCKLSQKNYAYFSHRDCEYFPCHPGADPDNFNCLFCYCPLYLLGEACNGNYTWTASGKKNCSSCLFPHKRENYDKIMQRYRDIAAAMPKSCAKNQTETSE